MKRTSLFLIIATSLIGCGGTASDPGSASAVTVTPTSGTTGTTSTTTSATTCLGSDLLASLGKTNLMIGFSDADATATLAPWDFRYLYLAGTIGDAPSCSSANGDWWGCWQDWSLPPGQYVTSFISTAVANHQVPMFTYYTILAASGAAEGSAEVAAANDASFMSRYFGDWRFLLTRIGSQAALLHVEPDFWGYAEGVNSNPHLIPAAVASANATDCSGYENSIAGLGRCLIAMARKYAPNAKIGLHASAWASGVDVGLNTDPSLDLAAEAAKVAGFLVGCGASSADYLVVEASDRDAGYYQSIGRSVWWDPTNSRLPDFTQALAWYKAIAEEAGRPLVAWQIPVGDMSQSDTAYHWQDNRVQYFFDHPDQLAAAHVVGIAYGAGASGQTTPSTDSGHLVSRAKSYYEAGGTPACP